MDDCLVMTWYSMGKLEFCSRVGTRRQKEKARAAVGEQIAIERGGEVDEPPPGPYCHRPPGEWQIEGPPASRSWRHGLSDSSMALLTWADPPVRPDRTVEKVNVRPRHTFSRPVFAISRSVSALMAKCNVCAVFPGHRRRRICAFTYEIV